MLGGDDRDKVLIVISDGGDNVSKHTLTGLLNMAGQSSALIYTIGIFDGRRGPESRRTPSTLAGNRRGSVFPRRAEEYREVCEGIARDIRNQYSLRYVSHNAAQPGAHRRIRVVARSAASGKLRVRARAGYISRPVNGKGSR